MTIDAHGNRHATATGRFETKSNSKPISSLIEPADEFDVEPLTEADLEAIRQMEAEADRIQVRSGTSSFLPADDSVPF